MKKLFLNNPDLSEIISILFCICGSNIIASALLSGTIFYCFDFIWRLCIIVFVLKVKKTQVSISKKQLVTLTVVFIVELIAYQLIGEGVNPYLLLISVIFAPVMEEILFRGFVYEKIAGDSKRKIILSSVLFGLYHFKNVFLLTPFSLLYQVLYAGLFVGPIFAVLRWKSGSIFAGILAHSLNNSLSEIFTKRLFPMLVGRRERFS